MIGSHGDRAAAVRARFHNEAAGPPNGTEVAMRCTDHGRFIMWVHPPTPPCRVACPPECGAPPEQGPALRLA